MTLEVGLGPQIARGEEIEDGPEITQPVLPYAMRRQLRFEIA